MNYSLLTRTVSVACALTTLCLVLPSNAFAHDSEPTANQRPSPSPEEAADDVALEPTEIASENIQAMVVIDTDMPAAPYSRMIFGGFLEHFHKQIYGGIFEPGSPLSDERGFRKDVIEAMKELRLSVVRWPGGCFASGYHWQDGVGRFRTPTPDPVWGVTDPNTFGTDEFVEWCRLVGCEPYICTNAGNGTPEEMRQWVEYCNATEGEYADLRRAGGRELPLGVKIWSIGNENWGGHEIGARTPAQWGPLVHRSAQLMLAADPDLKLAAAATPNRAWTLPLLKAAGRHLDYVAVHQYWLGYWQQNAMPDYLPCMMHAEGPEQTIVDVIAILEEAAYRGKIKIAFDEWNLRGWHHPGFPRKTPVAPNDKEASELVTKRDINLIDRQYTMADALFSASFLNACLRHSEDVGMANIAPIVNTRGPMHVFPAGIVKRTTFHTLAMYANLLESCVAKLEVTSGGLTHAGRAVAVLDAVATVDETGHRCSIALVNRHPTSRVACTVKMNDVLVDGTYDATILKGDSPNAYNDITHPRRVVPQKTRVTFNKGTVDLPPHSLTIAAVTRRLSAVQDVADKLMLDFPTTPCPHGWNIEGFAFGTRTPNVKERQKAQVASRNQRQYQSGKMTSPEFVVDRDYMKVECAGVFHPTLCSVRLVVDGEDVRSCSPDAGSGFLGAGQRATKSWFDLRPLNGKKATIEVRDNHANGYFALVKIVATNRRPPAGAKLITHVARWSPDHYQAPIKGDYLLLPVGPLAGTPLQQVTVEIDDRKTLAVDLPLAFGSIPIAGYLPVLDLTDHQGKPLSVSFHSYDGHEPSMAPAKVLMQGEILGRKVSDQKPAFHIHNRVGLLNDPNGLCCVDGVYHLFHQYNYNINASSWAHYTSTDLMHWEERPFGLFHDNLGSMHSGSAAVDVLNTSGWQIGDTAPVIAAYTASRGMGGSDKIQVQGIAYSVDSGKTFAKYDGNPVIGKSRVLAEGSDNARDPKLFWFSPTRGRDPHAEDGYWVIILFEGDSLTIYTSKNLKDWERHGSVQGFHECPELFPLAIDGDPGNVRWVMYGGSGQYHIGSFDGKSFTPETENKIPMYHGGRCYAAQTFNNTEEGYGGQPRRIQVAWQGGRGGQLSTPVELTLRTTPLGLRVCTLPVREISALYIRSVQRDGKQLAPGDANPLSDVRGGLYDIELEADLSQAKQAVLDIRGSKLVVRSTDKGLVLGKMEIPDTKVLSLRIVVDHTSMDVFFGKHGLYYSPRVTKPSPTKTLNLTVTDGEVTLTRLRVHELKSIWRAD